MSEQSFIMKDHVAAGYPDSNFYVNCMRYTGADIDRINAQIEQHEKTEPINNEVYGDVMDSKKRKLDSRSGSSQHCSACGDVGHKKETCINTQTDAKIDLLVENGFSAEMGLTVKSASQPDNTLALRQFISDFTLNASATAGMLKAWYRKLPADVAAEFRSKINEWVQSIELNQQKKEAELAAKKAEMEAKRLEFEMAQRAEHAKLQANSGTSSWLSFSGAFGFRT